MTESKQQEFDNDIVVEVVPTYLSEQSVKDEQRYVFSYQVTIHNYGTEPVKLLHRHWLITDGNGQVQEVHGEGVVGQQPVIGPDEYYQYESGSVLSTLVGSMQGHYEMEKQDEVIKVRIPVFTLAVPNVLN